MIVGHFMGIPIEENVMQLAPAAMAMFTAAAIAGRASVSRLLARLRRRSPGEEP